MKWNLTDLEIVEALAEYESLIASEDELSELFDSDIAPHVIKQYGEDDFVAMNEAFSNWSDGLQKDGIIHETQSNSYCYIGKYSD